MARGALMGATGVMLAVVAGFLSGATVHSSDPELLGAAYHGLGAWALLLVLAGAIDLGRRPPPR